MAATDHAVVVVTTSTETEDQARALAAAVVRERLAACAQIHPIQSLYRWEGTVRESPEWRVDLKTRADLADRLTAFVAEHHDYDVPEIIVVPVVGGGPAYLGWVAAETVPGEASV
ncbi:divalent-cation tolerance protein CutA [Kitasatospora sp. NPDC088351]|uniref:divalent-cation tolerance protein CutA n=1 Tax=unclassified Kitasatospora TaxID=2633591 RepID=UPI003434225C